MKAIHISDYSEYRVEETSVPEPTADDVLIEVDRVQLSVTECMLYQGESTYAYSTIQDRLKSGDERLFGHEFCGTVVEIGDDISGFDIGDRVYAPRKIPCKSCNYCQRGYHYLCENKVNIGFHRPGALAEFISLPSEVLCHLPDDVSDAEGAAMQPLASSLTCVYNANINVGDVVAVVGTGVMGYQIGQLALVQGASKVYALDIDSKKLEIAEKSGLKPLEIGKGDIVQQLQEETNGIGADIVFEAVGGNQEHATNGQGPLATAYELVRNGGSVVQVGYIPDEVTFDPRDFRYKYISWINPLLGVVSATPNSDTGELAVEFVSSDRVSIQEYITHELYGLDEFEKAVDITLNKSEYDALGPAQIIL